MNDTRRRFLRACARVFRIATSCGVIMCGVRGLHAQDTPRPVNDDSRPAVSPDGRRIAFQSTRAGFADIYVMDTDGSFPARLTRDARNNTNPAWSPDGTRIVFQSNRDGEWRIYGMNADGSGTTPITGTQGTDPSFSADGRRVLFVAPSDSVPQIWDAAVDGSEARQLTASPGAKSQPAASPDGTLLAFVSDASGGQEIYVSARDGRGERRVSRFTDDHPRRFINGLGWTPQGELIFAANRATYGRYWYRTDLYTMRPDGSALRRFIGGIHGHNNPSMARDGSRVAFDSYRYGGLDVFVADGDGTGIRNLTQTARNNWYAFPTPDGSEIVFQSEREGNREIYIMNADGTNVRNLSNHPEDDRAPYLSADGREIAFISFRHSQWGDIYTMDIDGGNVRKVTPDGFFEKLNQFAIATFFTPDGNTIFFESVPILVQGEAHWDIWRIDRDGTNARRLTNTPGTARSSFPEVSPDGRRLVYHSNETGNSEIYAMSVDGGDPMPLTDDPGEDIYPAWSPDGQNIYFASTRDGPLDIYVMDRDGGNVSRVTHGSEQVGHSRPRPLPDGRGLIVSTRETGTVELYRVGLDGSGKVRLSGPSGPDPAEAPLGTGCSGFTRLASPSWSWARGTIAFTGDCGGTNSLFVYDEARDVLQHIETGVHRLDGVAWSNSGDEIAFTAFDADSLRDVYVLDVASGRAERITHDGAHGGSVSWSPGDEWLGAYGPDGNAWNVFWLKRDGSERIQVNPSDGGRYFNLTRSPSGDAFAYTATNAIVVQREGSDDPVRVTPRRIYSVMPHWSPDGDWLVFDGNDGTGWELYRMRPDGSELERLTMNRRVDSNASWSSDGRRMVHQCVVNSITTLCILDVATRRTRALFRP